MIAVSNKEITNSERFKVLFNHAPLGIIFLNNEGEIQSLNPFCLNLFGYTMDEMLHQPIEMLIAVDYRISHLKHRNDYYKHPKNRPMGLGMDLYARKKDATEFPVEVSLTNKKYQGKEHVIAFIRDNSIGKKAEAEIEDLKNKLEVKVSLRTKALRDALTQLEVSNEKLENSMAYQKAIVDNAGAMIIATDENGVIKLFNPEAVVNIGYEESEMVEKKMPLIFHDKKEIDLKRKELFQQFGINFKSDFDVMVEKARRNIHEEQEFTYIRKDGSRFPVSLTITAIRDSKGEITGYMGISSDISERKKTEKDLMVSLEKQKELNELKSRFVSMASHEFRTPLSTILSSAYLIEKYTTEEDQPKREKHLQRIISSVSTLTDILNDFLNLGKIEEGKLQVKYGNVNIQDLVRSILDEIKSTLKAKQKVRYRHRGNPVLLFDISLLKHIITNLVSNAIKFSPEGSPIEIITIHLKDCFMLSVKDLGIGISEEDQHHLMERFFRGANAGNIQGTGLGLHIVSKYVQLMKGTMECKSKLEKGTEFVINFNTKTPEHENNSIDRR
jgi:PAS domain S-box-containing protein